MIRLLSWLLPSTETHAHEESDAERRYETAKADAEVRIDAAYEVTRQARERADVANALLDARRRVREGP